MNSLRDNKDGTCNCRPLGGSGCFFTAQFTGGPCDCKCHTPQPTVEGEVEAEASELEIMLFGIDMFSFKSQRLEALKKLLSDHQATTLRELREWVSGLEEENNFSAAYDNYTEERAIEAEAQVQGCNRTVRTIQAHIDELLGKK
jgi:hypothetical protein